MKTSFADFLKRKDEGYRVLPPIDNEKYPERPGLEGPFMTNSGKVLYYDPEEGKYYDSTTDMYVSEEDYRAYDHSDEPYHQSPLTDPTSKDYQHMKRKGLI